MCFLAMALLLVLKFLLCMSSFLPKSILSLIEEFSKLPGVGPKSAQRLTMHLLHSPEKRVQGLADAVNGLKTGLSFCTFCWNISEEPVCKICSDPMRNNHQICVVEEILDVVALEKTCEFKGVYHVLHGVLSPVDGIGPDQIKAQALMDRILTLVGADAVPAVMDGLIEGEASVDGHVIEVILATNPGLEGETTALYLMRLLKPYEDVKVTRIARGLPVGGDLDYADEMTLTKALQGRVEYV